MFTNYEKLSKELIKLLRQDPEVLSQLVKAVVSEIELAEDKKEIKDKFVQECMADLRKVHKFKLIEQLSKRNFALDVQLEMRKKIQRELEEGVRKILED
jgi:hypothetical protein